MATRCPAATSKSRPRSASTRPKRLLSPPTSICKPGSEGAEREPGLGVDEQDRGREERERPAEPLDRAQRDAAAEEGERRDLRDPVARQTGGLVRHVSHAVPVEVVADVLVPFVATPERAARIAAAFHGHTH